MEPRKTRSRSDLQKVHCSECFYWERIKESDSGMGTCRRYAPTAVVFPPHVVNGFQLVPPALMNGIPHTHETFWCGEGRVSFGPPEPDKY